MNNDAQLWCASSDNGGASWSNVKVSQGTSNGGRMGGLDYGDYTFVSYAGGVACLRSGVGARRRSW